MNQYTPDKFSHAQTYGDDYVRVGDGKESFGGGDMLTVEDATIAQLYNDLEIV